VNKKIHLSILNRAALERMDKNDLIQLLLDEKTIRRDFECRAPDSAAYLYHKTKYGQMIHGDSLSYLREQTEKSVDLVVTSPPFGLVRKKDYGNVDAHEYCNWFRPFAKEIRRILKDSGSFVVDIGGAWKKGQPTRSLYHFELLIMLCEEYGFHLAQEFYWWNPAKLPSPAEWVTIRRIRVKDAINTVWWLSATPWPKASNKRVLQPYSDSMKGLLKNGYQSKKRPSGHDISNNFSRNNGAAIPPNLIALPNTESNGQYQRYCKEQGLSPHPARFPSVLPEYFIRMLTDSGDHIIDPFGGSCVTGEVCERLARNWSCVELEEEYLKAAMGRFISPSERFSVPCKTSDSGTFYKLSKPDSLWFKAEDETLDCDGGKTRRLLPKVESTILEQ